MNDPTHTSLESSIAELYGSPLVDFIRSRDALAKRLRSAGDREAASLVKSLRKPSRPAWVLNRVVNQAPESLSALEGAVGDLIDAHGGSTDVRAAMATLRGAIRGCATLAEEESRSAGFSLDIGVLSNAILAVLGNPSSYDEFRRGRLVEIPEAGGLDFLSSLPARPKLEVSASRPPPSPEIDPADVDPGERAAARERARLAARDLETARADAETAATALNEAASDVAAARERIRIAESELNTAQQRQEFARRTNEAASAELRRAEAENQDAQRRLEGVVSS